MKLAKQVVENLIEGTLAGYELLRVQHYKLSDKYNSLERDYIALAKNANENNLVPAETFTELKNAYSQAAVLLSQAQEELNRMDEVTRDNEALKTQVYDLGNEVLQKEERIEDLKHSYEVKDTELKIEFANNQKMHKLMKEAQEKADAADYEARMYKAKYEDLHSRIKPASSLYKPLVGQTFEMETIEGDNTPNW